MLGVQLDGYAVTHAETIVLSSKAEGTTADVIKAAYDAAQIAMRTVKAGAKNWDVTEVINKVVKEYECTAVEGMLSCQHEKNVTDGKKRIIMAPSPEQRREHETATFEEGEVYGVDVLVVTGSDGKVSLEQRDHLRVLCLMTPLGQGRPEPNIHLQKGRHQLPIEDEDIPSRLWRDQQEGRSLPIHPTSFGRREASEDGRRRGCRTRSIEAVRDHADRPRYPRC